MDINNIANTIKNNADKVGIVLGLFSGAGGLDDWNRIMQSLPQAHFPNVTEALRAIATSPVTRNAVLGMLIGWGLEEINLPYIGKFGAPISKGAGGLLLGHSLLQFVWYSTVANSPPELMAGKGYTGSNSGKNPYDQRSD